MRRTIFTLSLLAAISFGASVKSSDLVSITTTKDNNIIQSATGVLSNALNVLTAGRTNQDATTTPVLSVRRALVYFDIASNVPVNSTIDSVRLSMYFSRTSGVGTQVYLHRLLKDWGEGTSSFSGGQGAPATQNDVTWLYTYYNFASPTSSPAWTTAGGDFDATISASSYAGTGVGTTGIEAYGLKSWASSIMTSEVQSWLTTPSANFGWLLQGDESKGQTAKQYLSRENGTAANCPILNVYYTKPGTTTGINSGLIATFSTYPNPATEHVTLLFSKANSERIMIYNTCGGLIKTVEPNNEVQATISLSDVKAGIYLIKAGSNTSRLVVK